jgi:D-glycero-D-manno-heptose 1,7-bisphosphate phosphatase
MQERLEKAGAGFDALQYCPHLPDAPIENFRVECDCRKPRPGMILNASRELGVDLAASILIGDRASDIEAGRAAGVGRCYLVRSGNRLDERDIAVADGLYADLAACVRGVLA